MAYVTKALKGPSRGTIYPKAWSTKVTGCRPRLTRYCQNQSWWLTDSGQDNYMTRPLFSHGWQNSLDYIHLTKEIGFELFSNKSEGARRGGELFDSTNNC